MSSKPEAPAKDPSYGLPWVLRWLQAFMAA
jgi:hypothetical protein